VFPQELLALALPGLLWLLLLSWTAARPAMA